MRRDLSLRRTLTTRLVAALLIISVAGAVFAYILTSSYANLAYDRALLDSAVSLAQQISVRDGHAHLDLPQSAKSVLLTDRHDQISYRVIELNSGRLLDQSGELGSVPTGRPSLDHPTFRDARTSAGGTRIVSIGQMLANGERVLVEVGETRHKRDLLIRDILIGLATALAALIFLTVGLVWRGITQSLAPLAALETQAAARSLDNLAPLEPGLAPYEVRGLIKAINQLMLRLDTSVGMQRRFTANAAHQLRTPLAALRLQAQLAIKGDDIQAIKTALLEIEQSAARTSHIVDQLLTLARAEVGQNLTELFDFVDLAQIARTEIERYVPQALAKQIDMGYEGDAHTLGLRGHPALLAELVANVLDNAIRYTQAGGHITVSVRESAQGIALSVCDNGPGIPLEQREQVFTRFFRGDTVPSEGAGLGLAIVKEIAERHQAQVKLEDGETGRGCKVLVQFTHGAASGIT